MVSGHLKTDFFILCIKCMSIWESACNRKKFMRPVRFSRNQILRWNLACRMFIKECFWTEHLWKGWEEAGLAERETELQFRPSYFLGHSSGHQSCFILNGNVWTHTPNLHQPRKWAARGMAWLYNEKVRAETKFSLEEYLDGISPCSP